MPSPNRLPLNVPITLRCSVPSNIASHRKGTFSPCSLLIKMGSRRRGSPSRFNRDKSRVWLSLTLRLRLPVPASISCGGRQSALWSNHKGTSPCAPGHPTECGCSVYASYQTGKPILDARCPSVLRSEEHTSELQSR